MRQSKDRKYHGEYETELEMSDALFEEYELEVGIEGSWLERFLATDINKECTVRKTIK